MATQNNQDYFRSVSSESTTYMMVPANGRGRDSPSKLWIAMVVIVVVVLQIASTTGLFVYLNMSLSQVSNLLKSCTDHFLVAIRWTGRDLKLSEFRATLVFFGASQALSGRWRVQKLVHCLDSMFTRVFCVHDPPKCSQGRQHTKFWHPIRPSLQQKTSFTKLQIGDVSLYIPRYRNNATRIKCINIVKGRKALKWGKSLFLVI